MLPAAQGGAPRTLGIVPCHFRSKPLERVLPAMFRRVVITGMGAVTPLATDVPSYWDRLLSGKSGIGFIELVDTREFKVKIGGEVKNWPPASLDSRTCRRMDRFSQFAMVAALEAVKDAGFDVAKEDRKSVV